MWHLYLDESGDLGFDFVNRKPSRFFTISILAISQIENNRFFINAIKKTIKRKLHSKGLTQELKGSKTSITVKKYFYKNVGSLKFGIYAITLNKKRLYNRRTQEKERVYNYVARLVLDQIPFEKAVTRVQLIVDKSKAKPEIDEFNSYIISQLAGRLDPKVPLNIDHHSSHESLGLQAADLFSWGIFRKYERKDTEWFMCFKERVRYDEVFLA